MLIQYLKYCFGKCRFNDNDESYHCVQVMSYWCGMEMIMLQISVLKKIIILHLSYQVGDC